MTHPRSAFGAALQAAPGYAPGPSLGVERPLDAPRPGSAPQGGAADAPAKPVRGGSLMGRSAPSGRLPGLRGTIRRLPGAAAVALAALVVVSMPAQAGLFDDDEARKAILDLRQRVRTVEDQSAATAAQQNETIESLRRTILSLNNDLEALRAEVARLRGNDEQLVRDVTELQRRQKDASQVLDDRLRKLEPTKVSIDGKEFEVTADERAAYEEAMGVLRTGDFDKASASLSTFLTRYPSSGYADSARFWLGNAQYGKRDYKGAIASFRAFVAAAPQHPRAPEALLALANSQAEAKDTRAARRTIEELLKTYPKSEAAVAGKERLASLK